MQGRGPVVAPKSWAPLQGLGSALEPPGLSLVLLGLLPSPQRAGPRRRPGPTLPHAPCVLVALPVHSPVLGSTCLLLPHPAGRPGGMGSGQGPATLSAGNTVCQTPFASVMAQALAVTGPSKAWRRPCEISCRFSSSSSRNRPCGPSSLSQRFPPRAGRPGRTRQQRDQS